MTIEELYMKLAMEKPVVGALQIECGRKCDYPGVLGIFEEAGVWYVYDTNDRGGIVILDKGNESEMVDALYRRILKIEKRILKKRRILDANTQ